MMLDHASGLLLLPTAESGTEVAGLLQDGLAAAQAGDAKGFEAARLKLEALRDAKPPSRNHLFGSTHGDETPLGCTGLPDEMLSIIENYLWDPSQPWRARLALRELCSREED